MGGFTVEIAHWDAPGSIRLHASQADAHASGLSTGIAIVSTSRPLSTTRAHLSRVFPRSATTRNTIYPPMAEPAGTAAVADARSVFDSD